MKNLLTGLLVLTLSFWAISVLSAQQSKLRKAQHYMEVLQYDKAIDVYDRLYQKTPESMEALSGLAKAYQKSGRLDDALAWYNQAVKQADLPPNFYYHYGQALIQNGDCGIAQVQFTEFLNRKPYDSRRHILEDVCTYWETISSKDNIVVSLDHPNFNSSGSDLAPAFFNESLVFGSVRQVLGEKHLSYDLYSVKPLVDNEELKNQIEYGRVMAFSSSLNSVLNEAIVTFSPDFTEVYFTRNRAESIDEKYPIRRLEISMAQQNMDGLWSAPTALSINNINYSSAHPALSPDGERLFFASDRPGGFGGKDIYVCHRNGLDWTSPVNLGPTVNTEGDELYPFYHQDGELYFASDGQLGLGGHDVFKVKELEEGIWGEVRNLGFPVNSNSDDFGLILSKDGSYGFLTSNREGGAGSDDIYAFRPKRILLELNLVDVDGQPINEEVALMEKNGRVPMMTNRNGQISFWLNHDECKYISIVDENYFPFAAEFCAADAENNDVFQLTWTLEKMKTIETKDFAVTKGESILHGTILDELTGNGLPGAKIDLYSKGCEESITVMTDENGQFVYRWEKDCCFDIMVGKNGFFSQIVTSPLCTRADGKSQELSISLAPYRLNESHENLVSTITNVGNNTTPTNDTYSSIPYKLNIYYDSGRASVRTEGLAELNRLKAIMDANPSLLVEVSSHTDTNGAAAFNWRLSQRRANAIVNYLIKRGVPSDRLIAKGYGEERLVNDCGDASDCSEEEHQLNRRTEFRVIDNRYGQSN